MTAQTVAPVTGAPESSMARLLARLRHEARRAGLPFARSRWCPLRVAAALVLAAGLGLAQSEAVVPPTPPGQPAAGAVSEADRDAGREALALAAKAKTRAYTLEGEARTAALLEVARQYGEVADTTRFGLDERCEAAFRAGELLRARGRTEDGLARFAQATRLGEPAEPASEARAFAARGLLEQGHALRRADDVEAALEVYAQLSRRFAEQQPSRVHARSWTVKLLVRGGRLDEALPVVEGFPAAHAEAPVESAKAAQTLCEALVEAGRGEEARRLVAALESGLDPAAHDGSVADRLASALDGLRVTVSQSGY